jgi:predicted nucleic acid-binding Zn ribbon protein
MLERFRRRAGRPGAAAARVGAAAAAWPKVVGAPVAAHSVPVRRSRAGMLTVACSSAAWAQELTARREELVRRLAERCPEAEVTGLRFAVADQAFAEGPAPEAAPAAPPTPTALQRAEGERAAAGVDDPALRALVARAAAASAARERHPSKG